MPTTSDLLAITFKALGNGVMKNVANIQDESFPALVSSQVCRRSGPRSKEWSNFKLRAVADDSRVEYAQRTCRYQAPVGGSHADTLDSQVCPSHVVCRNGGGLLCKISKPVQRSEARVVDDWYSLRFS